MTYVSAAIVVRVSIVGQLDRVVAYYLTTSLILHIMKFETLPAVPWSDEIVSMCFKNVVIQSTLGRGRTIARRKAIPKPTVVEACHTNSRCLLAFA